MHDLIYTIIEIEKLRPHEEFVESDVVQLAELLKREGVVKEPVLVDRKTLVILNGHHRVEALKRLGMKYAPVLLVPYESEEIIVDRWPDAKDPVSKDEVIRRGKEGKLYPPKTSKHTIKLDVKHMHTNIAILK